MFLKLNKFWVTAVVICSLGSASSLLALPAERVRERFSLLYEAVDFAFDGDSLRIARFFEAWSEEDLDFAFYELRSLVDMHLRAAEVTGDACRYTTTRVKGVLGEIHGVAYLRIRRGPRDILLTDSELRRLPKTSRPDSLLYEVRGTTLLIKAIFESKINERGNLVDWQQVQRYFDHWKKAGIVVLDANLQRAHFPADNIAFENGPNSAALPELDSPERLQPYLYYLAHDGTASATSIQAPTDYEGFDRIAFRLSTVIPGNPGLGPEQRAKLEAELFEVNQRRLEPLLVWMRQHKRWPRQNHQTEEEKAHRTWVINNNGRAQVWKRLPDDIRSFYEVRLDSDAEALLADYRQGKVTLTPEQVLDVRMTVEPIVVISEWMTENDRWPSQKIPENTLELRLARTVNKKSIGWVITQLPEALRNRFHIRAQVQGPEMLADHREGRITLTDSEVLELRLLHEPRVVLLEWMREHKSWPRAGGIDASPTERRLGQYINWQGSCLAVYPTLPDDIRDLPSVKLKYEVRSEGRYLTRLPQNDLDLRMVKEPLVVLIEWMRDHKRWPRIVGTQLTELEKKLGNYVGNTGSRPALYPRLPKEIQTIFEVRAGAEPEAYLANWKRKQVTLTDDQVFELRLLVNPVEALSDWMREHQRWPRHPGDLTETQEGRLGTYVSRYGGKAGLYEKLPEAIKNVFTIRLEVDPKGLIADHHSGKRLLDEEQLFEAYWAIDALDAIARLMRQTGRWPRSKSKIQAIPPRELKAGGWIGNHGALPGVYAQLPLDVRALFAVRLPADAKGMLEEYRANQLALTPDQLTQVKMTAEPFQTLVEFVREHRQWPTQKTKLGEWLSKNGGQGGCFEKFPDDARALILIRLNVEPDALWADIQTGRVKPTDDELFEVRMKLEPHQMLYDWMRQHGGWPRSNSKDYREKRLGGWLGNNGKRQGISQQLPNDLAEHYRSDSEPKSCAAALTEIAA